MNTLKYKWILYAIVTVIIATIGIQIYWNYKNYQTNKQQLINEVQISLDKAVDDYYADLAERTTVSLFFDDGKDITSFEKGKISSLIKNINYKNKEYTNLDSIKTNSIDGITVIRGLKADSLMLQKTSEKEKSDFDFPDKEEQIKLKSTSIDSSAIKMLTSKVMISFNNDTLDIKKVKHLLIEEFERKRLSIDFKLLYKEGKNKGVFPETVQTKLNDSIYINKSAVLSTTSKSTFLPKGSTLKVQFSNETKVILKRILGGILISTVLVLAVISSLFYLLKIINHQKQLAEVKNDIISNITHEFKTPIATISAALESISSFNAIDDKAKTKQYLNMSSEQLSKLNIMVEKLLETATLDSDNLELNTEDFDIIALLQDLIKRYQMQFPTKTFHRHFQLEEFIIQADLFHFENALNNIFDNAVKYGGDIISVELIAKNHSFDLLISDNGNSLTKANKDRVFEKFFRVPKGNTHDVKGFGIGLYYTKTIIEKHKGSITLSLNKDLTTFKITVPNG